MDYHTMEVLPEEIVSMIMDRLIDVGTPGDVMRFWLTCRYVYTTPRSQDLIGWMVYKRLKAMTARDLLLLATLRPKSVSELNGIVKPLWSCLRDMVMYADRRMLVWAWNSIVCDYPWVLLNVLPVYQHGSDYWRRNDRQVRDVLRILCDGNWFKASMWCQLLAAYHASLKHPWISMYHRCQMQHVIKVISGYNPAIGETATLMLRTHVLA